MQIIKTELLGKADFVSMARKKTKLTLPLFLVKKTNNDKIFNV